MQNYNDVDEARIEELREQLIESASHFGENEGPMQSIELCFKAYLYFSLWLGEVSHNIPPEDLSEGVNLLFAVRKAIKDLAISQGMK